MVIESEGWIEGGDRKLPTPKEKAEETVVENMLEAVMRVPPEPTQEITELMF
jgi:hypothetical protein